MTNPTASVYPAAYRIDAGSVPIAGTIRLPGSKSITNRALLASALASGSTVLENALFCDDSVHMADALIKLGVLVAPDEHLHRFRVKGAGGTFPTREAEVFLGNAGTATRFLTAALCIPGGRYTVDGDARMRERPIGDLVKALRDLGAEIEAPTGCPPVRIGRHGPGSGSGTASGAFNGGTVVVSGRISSQFISAILLAAPYARRDVEVLIEGVCVSRPYIDITISVMRSFGAAVRSDEGRADGRTSFRVVAGRGYRPPPLQTLGRFRAMEREQAQEPTYEIEGDASTASYFMAGAALTGGILRVEGIGKESIQGDARFADVLAAMGAHVKKDLVATGVTGDTLKGVEVDCADMPDVVPTLAALALFARGRTRIRNVAHLRFKESDRITSVATELRKLGGRVKDLPDGLEIEESRLRPAVVDTWNDHRIAMAAAVIGLRVPGLVIRDPKVVAKSFPEFFDVFRTAGAQLTPLDPGDIPPDPQARAGKPPSAGEAK